MSIAQGTPTFWQKAAVAIGAGAAIGLTPAEIAQVQTGDQADLHAAVADIESLLGPTFKELGTVALGDVNTFLQGVLTLIPGITSLSGAVNVVKAVAAAEEGDVGKQLTSLSQGALTTLVSAAAVGVGKLNLSLVPPPAE